jgi:hypothetical protein
VDGLLSLGDHFLGSIFYSIYVVEQCVNVIEGVVERI